MTPEEAEVEARGLLDSYHNALQTHKAAIISSAIRVLDEDIKDPGLNEHSGTTDPNVFVRRANYIGVALIWAGYTSVALDLYQELIKRTTDYRSQHGVHRHAGALYANMAVAWAYQGNLQAAMDCLMPANREDELISGATDPLGPNTMTDQLLGANARAGALDSLQMLDTGLSVADVHAFYFSLPERQRLRFLASVSRASVSIQGQGGSQFNRGELSSSLRDLAVQLETHLAGLAAERGQAVGGKHTLYDVSVALYQKGPPARRPWWPRYQKTVDRIWASRGQDHESALRDTLAVAPEQGPAFHESLLASYFTRQYTAHHPVLPLSDLEIQRLFAHVLHSIIAAEKA